MIFLVPIFAFIVVGIGYAWLSPSFVDVPFTFPDIEMDVTFLPYFPRG